MFQINSTSNEIVQLVPKRFSDLGFTERGHLQEWMAKMPESLGEELLIIQKEFDGFDETQLLPHLLEANMDDTVEATRVIREKLQKVLKSTFL
ncbi:MAG TPA: hypothetical protein DCX06_05140 [Opitutae bacterium]|nr:hypothetical protein [Opitutae bacterium]